MRPRKRVLTLSDGDREVLRSQMHLRLHVWGYFALDAVEPGGDVPDAVITLHMPLDQIPLAVVQQYPANVIAYAGKLTDGLQAVRVGAHHWATTPEELRDRLRLACARKRGPKVSAAKMQERAA